MASPPVLDDPNHAARRAKTRIAVAAVLLTIAIGGLTLLSRQQPAEKTEEAVPQKQESISSGETPIPNQEPAPAQISSKDQEMPPPPVEPVSPENTPPVTTAPVTPASPATPPPPPQVTNPQPLKNRPAPAVKATGPVSPVPSEPVTPAVPASEKPATAPMEKAKPAEQKPAPAQSKPAPAPQAQTKPAPEAKNFVVQVGVFTDMDNARLLQSKLTENGIPSHTETKLQLGPFNTKGEADSAREKLKNLGIGSVVIPGK